MMYGAKSTEAIDRYAIEELLQAMCDELLEIGQQAGCKSRHRGEYYECSLAFSQGAALPDDDRQHCTFPAGTHGAV